MRKPGILALATAAASCGALALVPLTAQAATTSVATWSMDEGPGVRIMTDSSPNGLTGSIGSDVVTGSVTDTSLGYQFRRPADGKHDSHLVLVDSPTLNPDPLNPGARNFAVTVRLRTTAGNQNILQKGQANTAGGYYKIDMVRGVPSCLFRDGLGNISAKKWSSAIWDGAFHSIRCARTGATGNIVSISVDGQSARTNVKALDSVANTKKFSIGGKLYCSPPSVGCDYFVGVIDSVAVEAG